MERAKTHSPWQWLRHQRRHRRYWLPERPRHSERVKELFIDTASPLPVTGAVYVFSFNGGYQEWVVNRVTATTVHFSTPQGVFAETMPLEEWLERIKTVKRLQEPPESIKHDWLVERYPITGTKTGRVKSSASSFQSLARSTGS